MSYKSERGKAYLHEKTGDMILLLGRAPSPFFHLRALHVQKRTGEVRYLADVAELGIKMDELEEVT